LKSNREHEENQTKFLRKLSNLVLDLCPKVAEEYPRKQDSGGTDSNPANSNAPEHQTGNRNTSEYQNGMSDCVH
jgi:hypothetical protein